MKELPDVAITIHANGRRLHSEMLYTGTAHIYSILIVTIVLNHRQTFH